LFCVGDDWQSIYRFTGSDVTVMRDFDNLFGFHQTLLLDRTYRFGEHLEEVSSTFIQRNPAQIKKRLSPDRPGQSPAVHVVVDKNASGRSAPRSAEALELALRDIARRTAGELTSVFILGRYNDSQLGSQEVADRICCAARNLTVRAMTAHKSKGLEADYVVVVDVNKEKRGFPCEITDDPVLELVLAHGDAYEYAEERRLFYVAMSRAREGVYFVATDGMLSDFLIELSEHHYGVEYVNVPKQLALAKCPSCEVGRLAPREGEYGQYLVCDVCGYRPGRTQRLP
jgi:DNA helicase-4